ncbi:MAG: DsrE/DsrF/DrsH-like family protein [Bacillota bacterium]
MADEKVSIIVFSGDLDKALAAFNIATGAAASGMDVTMFFTFWGINMLKKTGPRKGARTLLGRVFDMFMPKGPEKLPLSKMNMGGMGSVMMRYQMAKKKVQPLAEFISMAKELGVKIVACTMSMEVMEIPAEDLNHVDEFAGVAAFLEEASKSKITLFI